MKTKVKRIITMLLVIGIIAANVFPAQAAVKKFSPFKTFKVGKLNLKTEVNRQIKLYDKKSYDKHNIDTIYISSNKYYKIKKGSRIKFKLKKGYKLTFFKLGYYNSKDKYKIQKLKNNSKLKECWSNAEVVYFGIRYKNWRAMYAFLPDDF